MGTGIKIVKFVNGEDANPPTPGPILVVGTTAEVLVAEGEGRKDEQAVVTATDVVDTWGEESADYSSAHDTCAWNRQCGHYTQIVWPTTEEVGCGLAVCPTLGQIWVCNYRPRGNTRVLR